MAKKRGIRVNVYNYIREHHGKGHSLAKIRKWLISYGYDGNFVSKVVKEFQRKQFAKKISLSSFIVAIILLFASLPVFNVNVTGAVTASREGCCIDNSGVCHESYSTGFCNSEDSLFIKYDCVDLPYCQDKTLP